MEFDRAGSSWAVREDAESVSLEEIMLPIDSGRSINLREWIANGGTCATAAKLGFVSVPLCFSGLSRRLQSRQVVRANLQRAGL